MPHCSPVTWLHTLRYVPDRRTVLVSGQSVATLIVIWVCLLDRDLSWRGPLFVVPPPCFFVISWTGNHTWRMTPESLNIVVIDKRHRPGLTYIPDSSRLDTLGEHHGLVDVVGEYPRRQAVCCVVGALDQLFHGLELDDALNWSEYLELYRILSL